MYAAREQDWRNGAVVYQVLVDRFAPGARLEAKRALYAPPRTLRRWDEAPRRGHYLEAEQLWSHELDFWGGDLASLTARLDHVQQLGAEVLYLNPIALAATNHKYDALDYLQVSPEYGTRDDVKALAAELHRRGMKLVLDGVFNHMGRRSERFRRAAADPASPERDWFHFGPQYEGGARGWWNVANLPELNLENPAVREHLWNGPDSVVRAWLRDGADGWRLDVAFDIGPAHLHALTQAAHAEKPGSLVVGEIPNYPRDWFPCVDGTMLFTLRRLLLAVAGGEIDGPGFTRFVARLVHDADFEHLLKSWLYLDNHDTPRLATLLPDGAARRLAQVLMAALPGALTLYYGSEVAMEGADDPEMRGPMRWDRVAAGHPDLDWTRRLVALRRRQRALRVGDFRTAEATGNVVAFERHTERVAETVLLVANPGASEVETTVLVPDSRLMDGELVDLLSGTTVPLRASLLRARVPPRTAWLLQPRLATPGGYSSYKRMP